MWTKNNDHAPKSECVVLYIYMCPQKGNFEKETNKPSLAMFLSSSSILQKLFHSTFIVTTFLCHGPLPFSTRAPLLPLPQQNPLDHVNG